MAGWDDFPKPSQAGEANAPALPQLNVTFADPEQHRVELALKHPLDVEGERVDTVIVHRLTAGEMIKITEAEDAPQDDAELIRTVIAAMIGWPRAVLDALSPDDSGRVAAAALPLLPVALVGALDRLDAAAVNSAAA